jgi:hypothetical protein
MSTQAGVGLAVRGRHGVVPYIVTWSAEEEARRPAEVMQTPYGIGYIGETLFDRDTRGVLWSRTVSKQGMGEPQYGLVHSLRQRRAMRRLLCQVCAGPADQNEMGTLWLLRDHSGDWPNWPEGMGNTHPPLCLRCAHISVKSCPWLRASFVAVRAHSTVAGVHGELYQPGYLLPDFIKSDSIAFDSPLIRWVRARHLIRTLNNCTIVSL